MSTNQLVLQSSEKMSSSFPEGKPQQKGTIMENMLWFNIWGLPTKGVTSKLSERESYSMNHPW